MASTTAQAAPVAADRRIDLRRIGLAAIAAAVGNLVVFAIGSVAGVEWAANGQPIGWFMVVLATLVPMAVGAGILALAARRWVGAPRVMAWVGLALAVVSVGAPFGAAPKAATAIALAAMHLVTGAAWFLAVRPTPSSRA